MKITVTRIFKGPDYTIGRLHIDGTYFCDTLEDPVRPLPPSCPDTPKGAACRCGEKVYARTAIPAGCYKLTMEHSPRFRRRLPYLHDVPHFLGLLIHSGNTADDSAGCLIVGRNRVKGKVLDSRVTLEALIARIEGAASVTIEIR